MVDASLVMSDGRAVPVRDGFVLGRVAGCDLVVDDSKCSRKHARICVEGSVVEILDLDSSNGTLLNGKPVQRRLLRDGDKIQIGATVIVYREDFAPAKAPNANASGGASAPSASATRSAASEAATPMTPSSSAPFAAKPPSAAPVPPPAKPPAAPMADDDVDLFGSEEPAAPPPPPPPPAPSFAKPPAPPSPPVAPPRPAQVVEFADEVVEVRATPKPNAPATAAAPFAAGQPTIEKKSRVLQFSKQGTGKGPLGDDLAQLSGGTRTLLYAAVLAGAAGIVWLIVWLMG